MRATGGMAGAGQADGTSTLSSPMVDDQSRAAMFVAAVTLQQCALSSYLLIEDKFGDLGASTEEEHDEQAETDTSQVMSLGSLVSVVAAVSPPRAPGSTRQGPYNQYQKCTQFFTISLEWPDRQFRHEYRSVTAFPIAALRSKPVCKG